MSDPNLFDGRLAVFFWQPGLVNETGIAALAAGLRAAAPGANAVVIYAGYGLGWPGRGRGPAAKPSLQVGGVADVQRWVEALAAHGLEAHAWCRASGRAPRREVERLAALCQHSGIQSLLLCVEPAGRPLLPGRAMPFVGGPAAAHALAAGLRERVGPRFHLGLMFDPRGDAPGAVHLQRAWFPEIDSLHPLAFAGGGQSPAQALQAAYAAVGHWGKPIYPVLRAFGANAAQVAQAVEAAARQHQAPGLSLFFYGRGRGQGMGADELAAAARCWRANMPIGAPLRPAAVPRRATPRAVPRSTPALTVVDPDDERAGLFTIGYYGDSEQLAQGWGRDHDVNGHARLYRAASYNTQTLYVGYVPRLAGKGQYVVEVFIPRDRAVARDVHYFIVDYPGGVRRETLAVLDQSPHYDVWVPLTGRHTGPAGETQVSVFELDPQFEDAGRVNVADVTFIDPATGPGGRFEMSFGAIRWRPVDMPVPEVIGFDSPVGTAAERAGPFADGRKLHNFYNLWCGNWYDANPIGTRYQLGSTYAIHTGADLNLEGPGGVRADKDAPVFAAADGRVVFSGWVSAGWKNVIIIEHPVPGENRVVYARYAHVHNMQVRANETVQRGQFIAAIGQYAPNNYHLHFDLTPDPVLKTVPGHWPGDNPALVHRVYVDPMAFIKERHVVR